MTPDTWRQGQFHSARTGYVPDSTGPGAAPSVRWVYESDRPVAAAPVVDERRVYAVAEDGTVAALDRPTGEPVWNVALGETVAGGSPAVCDDLIIIAGIAGTVWAVETATGSVRWQCEVGAGGAVPTVVDGVVYLSGRDEPLVARDVTDGSVCWEQPAITDAGAVAAAEGLVVCVDGTEHAAVDAATGQLEWRRGPGGVGRFTPPVVTQSRVYSPCADDAVRAYDIASGEVHWAVDCSHLEYEATLAPPLAVDDDRVYVGHFPNVLRALDAASGERAWSVALGDDDTVTTACPVVAGGTVYAVGVESGDLYRVDPTTGDVRWRFEPPQEPVSPPVVADETLFVGCLRDAVCAIE